MTADAKTVTVIVIKLSHPNFKTVTVTVIWGKQILKSNKTAGNNFDSNGNDRTQKLGGAEMTRILSDNNSRILTVP